MKVKVAGLAVLLGLASALIFSQAHSAPAIEKSLLVNGSFEEGPDTDKYVSLNEGSKAIKGWVVTRGQIDYVDAYWPAADGKRSIDLHGSPGLGGIKQTFATRKGQKYRVTFAFAGNPEGQVPMKKMGVSAAGQKEEFSFDATGKKLDDLGWVTKKWEFKADDKETTLEFYTLMTDDVNCGPLLDNVSVFEID
ncbi:MAG TPA: choice-of-anchor C family protein [Gemmataceae bacterium]|jgi:choice-of-anchor C domain-containing protein